MANVKLVTDSSVHLDPEEITELGITIVPIQVRLGRKTYREGVDLSQQEFFRKLAQLTSLPAITSTPSQRLREQYIRLGKQTDTILSIHLSRHLADVYSAAEAAAEGLRGRIRVVAIDSQTTSFGLGVLVRAAAEAAAQGMSLEEIIRMIRGMIPHLYGIFAIEDLDYLHRDGRIDIAQRVLGTMLGIKPLLTLEEGKLVPLEKVRTRARVVDKLYEFITEFSSTEQMAIVQADFAEETTNLLERLETARPEWDFPVITYGPSLSAHLGPSAMGVIVYEGMR